MTNVNTIIEALRSTSSRNTKEAILERNKENEVLKQFFFLALDPFVNFYQKKIPDYTTNFDETFIPLTCAMAAIESKLSSRQITGNAAIDYLKKTLSILSPEDARVLELVVQKDPDCGVSEATVNKIWPGLIRTYPVMLCSAFDQKLVDRLHWQKGVYVQLKSDGMRCNIIVNGGTVQVFSRNGRPIETHGVFDYLAKFNKNFVIDGELLVRNGDKFLDRKTGNGICNKALKGTGTKAQAETFYLNAWDCIPYTDFQSGLCTDAYKTRFIYLQGIVGDIHYFTDNVNIGVIESKVVHSLSEAQAIFEAYLVKGEEGAILKDKTAIWEDKRSKQLVKLKAELDADLKVVDVKPGTGKYEGQIGALICTDADGTLNVNVGSGFSDEQRSTLKPEELIGKIVTVTYNAKIQAKDGTWSLFLPRLIEIREDKDNANTFKEIK